MKRYGKLVIAVASLCAVAVVAAPLASAAPPTVGTPTVESVGYASAYLKANFDSGDEGGYYATFEVAELPGEVWSGCYWFENYFEGGTGSYELTKELTGLQPGTEYAVRLCALSAADFFTEVHSPEPNPTFTTEPVGPPTVTIDPVTTFDGTTATLTGTIDPEATEDDPAFDVHWQFQCTPECPGLEGVVNASQGETDISAVARGLKPKTAYEVTLVGSNASGPVSAGPEAFTTTSAPPEIGTLFAGELAAEGATLAGRINPRFSAVTYQFEWGTDDTYGNLAPATPQPLGHEDNGSYVVTAPLTGLDPGATYHFRFVAENDAGQTAEGVDHSFATLEPERPPEPQHCPNEKFRKGTPSESLPDCMAFEKVTPQDKNGGEIQNTGTVVDGNHVFINTTASFLPDDTHNPGSGWTVGTRTAAGWGLSPKYLATDTAIGDFSDDFDREMIVQSGSLFQVHPAESLLAGDTDTASDVYLREGDELQLISTGSLGGNGQYTVFYAGQTPDASRIYFQTAEQLEPEGPGREANAVQSYERANGETHVLGTLPDARCAELSLPSGCVDPGGAVIGAGLETIGGEEPEGGRGVYGAIRPVSADGARIYFTSPDPLRGGEAHLFLREGANVRQVDVSKCERTPPEPPCIPSKRTLFTGASVNGSVVYFSTRGQLVDSDIDGYRDLYRYDIESDSLIRVTDASASAKCGQVELPAPYPCGFIGISAISDDGSRVYFTGSGDLAPGAEQSGPKNFPSLFLYDAGSGEVRFLGVPADAAAGSVIPGVPPAKFSATPDGARAVFSAKEQLTSYDSDGATEVYIYDAIANSLTCISCNSLGAPAVLRALHRGNIIEYIAADLGSSQDGSQESWGSYSRPASSSKSNELLSDDGRTVLFRSVDTLVPADTDELFDTYMWRDGELSMLTGGHGSSDARPVGLSDDGESLFFISRERLVPADRDQAEDFYGARVDGGLAADNPDPELPPCAAEGCRDGVPGPGSTANPATQAPRPASEQAKRCPRDKVKRRGRCVKRKHRKLRRHRNAGNKGGTR